MLAFFKKAAEQIKQGGCVNKSEYSLLCINGNNSGIFTFIGHLLSVVGILPFFLKNGKKLNILCMLTLSMRK